MTVADLPPLWTPPKPAIFRSGADLLRPGYFPSQIATRAEARAILTDLVRAGRLTRDQAKHASLLLSIVGWSSRIGGNDAYTKLLLHCDGTNGSTTFTDSSASAHTVTANGGAAVSTSVYKFPTGSAGFNGTNANLTVGNQADWAFGTGDFTIDFWFYANALNYNLCGSTIGGTVSTGISASKLYVDRSGTGTIITGTTVLSTGVWYHVALVRSSGSIKLYLNGTQEGSTYSTSFTAYGPAIYGSGNGANYFNGYEDEIRVSNGIARWTANFTPPTQAYG